MSAQTPVPNAKNQVITASSGQLIFKKVSYHEFLVTNGMLASFSVGISSTDPS